MTTDTPHPMPQPWREDNGTIVLLGEKCSGCGKRFFPKVAFCDQCDGDTFEVTEIGARGNLYSFSEIHVAPKAFKTPYVVGYVDFGDDVRVFGQIDHPAAELDVDIAVKPVIGTIRTNADGTAVTGYRFCKEG